MIYFNFYQTSSSSSSTTSSSNVAFHFRPVIADPRPTWAKIMGFEVPPTVKEIKARYRDLAKLNHPDTPTGSTEKMKLLNAAYEQAMKAMKDRA